MTSSPQQPEHGVSTSSDADRGPADLERPRDGGIAERAALLEQVPQPIIAQNADHAITFWNAAAERAYGFTSQEAMGRDPRQLLSSEYLNVEHVERMLEAPGTWEGDVVHTTKDGRRVTVASCRSVLRDPGHEVVGFLEIHRDITLRLQTQAARERGRADAERERMSTRLIRAQRLESLGQLTGGIAHDFNNLLAVISTYSGVISLQLDDLRAAVGESHWRSLSDELGAIGEAAEQAAALTRQLLSFAQQESVTPGVIDLNDAITSMLDMLTRTLGGQIRVAASLEPALAGVRINSSQLSQILVNLAFNSRSAMPEGGQLGIETTRARFDGDQLASHGLVRPGSYVRLRVTDTGEGMSPEVIEHAFDPFFTTRAVGEGTGLGLATVHGIVCEAGGRVEICSQPGRGTTITVLLPAADELPAENARLARG